jgi:pilus assembly protein CpaB
MRRSGRILIVLGVILGLVTALGAFVFLSQQNLNPVEQIASRPVVVALQNITERGEILGESVGVVNWPSDSAPPNSFLRAQDVVGKIAIQPIYQGQLIVPQMILAKPPPVISATGSIASFLLPEGKVAMAFQVGEVSGVANAIQPGDTVDVLLTLSPNLPLTTTVSSTTARTTTPTATGTEGLAVTQIMLQDVLVIHIGTWASPSQGNAPAASGGLFTLSIDRQDALALKAARENGQIDLVLRRVGDHKTYDLEPVNLQYLNKRFKFSLLPGSALGGGR